MKKFTKMFVGVFCALLLVTSAFAADTAVKAGSAVQTTATTTTSLFNAGEVGLSLGTAYDLGSAGSLPASVSGKTLFNTPYTLNFNAGAFWFPFRNLGFEANVPLYQNKGVSVDEVQVGVLLRLPLAKTTPVLRNLSPYIGADAVYGWNAVEKWSYIGKAGLEVRLNKHWGVFGEGQYRNDTVTGAELKNGNVSLNGGLRLVF